MSETGQIIFGICILIIVYVMTRRFHAWRMKRTYFGIIDDLKQKEAIGPSSAVELPYAKKSILKVGTRDYRPKAIEYMVAGNIIGKTDSEKYYLIDKK